MTSKHKCWIDSLIKNTLCILLDCIYILVYVRTVWNEQEIWYRHHVLSDSVINNVSNQNLQKCLWLISIPNFEKCDSSRHTESRISVLYSRQFVLHAIDITASTDDAYFRTDIIIHNFMAGDASTAPTPQFVRLPRLYYSQTASDNGEWPT